MYCIYCLHTYQPRPVPANNSVLDITYLLLQYMAQNGWTALLFACESGHDEAVNILIQAGADLNIHNNVGTALFLS